MKKATSNVIHGCFGYNQYNFCPCGKGVTSLEERQHNNEISKPISQQKWRHFNNNTKLACLMSLENLNRNPNS